MRKTPNVYGPTSKKKKETTTFCCRSLRSGHSTVCGNYLAWHKDGRIWVMCDLTRGDLAAAVGCGPTSIDRSICVGHCKNRTTRAETAPSKHVLPGNTEPLSTDEASALPEPYGKYEFTVGPYLCDVVLAQYIQNELMYNHGGAGETAVQQRRSQCVPVFVHTHALGLPQTTAAVVRQIKRILLADNTITTTSSTTISSSNSGYVPAAAAAAASPGPAPTSGGPNATPIFPLGATASTRSEGASKNHSPLGGRGFGATACGVCSRVESLWPCSMGFRSTKPAPRRLAGPPRQRFG
jgi:hypothetical protein